MHVSWRKSANFSCVIQVAWKWNGLFNESRGAKSLGEINSGQWSDCGARRCFLALLNNILHSELHKVRSNLALLQVSTYGLSPKYETTLITLNKHDHLQDQLFFQLELGTIFSIGIRNHFFSFWLELGTSLANKNKIEMNPKLKSIFQNFTKKEKDHTKNPFPHITLFSQGRRTSPPTPW